MKIRISILLLLIFQISLVSCAQRLRSNNSNEIYGSYVYVSADSLSGMRIEIKDNGSFDYVAGGDIHKAHAFGHWRLDRDTVLLTSSIDRNNIPISVAEIVIDSMKDKISLSLVDNVDGEVMMGIVSFNNDTTTECIPIFGTGCEMKSGSIENFRVDFNNGTYSKWYKIKNKNANLIMVTANIYDVRALFIKNENFLLRSNNLYPLDNNEIGELDRDGNMMKRKIILRKVPSGSGHD